MLMDIKVLLWKLVFKIVITRETPWCIIKLLCVSSLTKISDETAVAFWCWRMNPKFCTIWFQGNTVSISGWGALVSRTGAKDLALWGRGLRSQRSQSSFTAHSSMRSTTDLCNKGWVLSIQTSRASGSLMANQDKNNSEGSISILTAALFANVFLHLGNRTGRG